MSDIVDINTANEEAVVLLVPATSFDFFGGEWADKRRTRLLNRSIAVVGIIVLAVLYVQTSSAWRSREETNAQLAEAKTKNEQLASDLARMANLGGLSEDRIVAHRDQRLGAVTAAIGKELDFGRLFGDIDAADSPVRVTDISIGEAATDPAAAPATGSPPIATLEIKGSAATISDVIAFHAHIKKLAYLVRAEHTYSDAQGGQVTFTVQAAITGDLRANRAQMLQEQLNPASKEATP